MLGIHLSKSDINNKELLEGKYRRKDKYWEIYLKVIGSNFLFLCLSYDQLKIGFGEKFIEGFKYYDPNSLYYNSETKEYLIYYLLNHSEIINIIYNWYVTILLGFIVLLTFLLSLIYDKLK